jgi:hypothetical protein
MLVNWKDRLRVQFSTRADPQPDHAELPFSHGYHFLSWPLRSVVLVSCGRAVLRLGALFRNSSGEYLGAARAATLLVRNRQPTS